ncbi:MAG: cation:proton antiporter [Sterolibacterium sp.]|jgi:Kef-type K+ transport system membrane component KefB
MPESISAMLHQTAWPVALALAWVAGEFGHRWLSLPRIASYGVLGFLLGSAQGGFLPESDGGPATLLANIAFGLILFELGYRINLRWVRANPWLGLTSVVEACGSFAAVFFIADWYAVPLVPALLLAAIAMSTSPAAVLRVANELRSSGQVTERILHLSAFNCVLAVVAFKFVVGYWVLSGSGSVFQAFWSSLVVLLVSAGLGALFGVAVPALLRALGGVDRNATAAFAIAVVTLTVLTHTLKFSPLLATLAFGLVARHRRIALSQAQRNFGALGDLLTVLLFVFVAAALDWRKVASGWELALIVVAARMAVKVAVTTVFARLGGISWRKGALTGMALTPLSVFAILLLEQSRHLGLDLLDELAAIAAIVLLLEVIGPLVTQRALIWAGETSREGGGEHGA